MNDVVETFGVCEGLPCKRGDRAITREADRVTVRDKNYHKGCEPTPEQLEAANQSST